MFKGFRQIASLTLFSRILGLIREICFAYFFGAGSLMDTWFIAFKIPNLSRRLFGEGAASASFIPVYTQQLYEDKKNAASLASTVLTIIVVILTVLLLLGWLMIAGIINFAPVSSETKLVLNLSALMLPFMVMICTVAIMAGILNVHNHFAAPAAAPVILNICIISATVLTGLLISQEGYQRVFFIAGSVLIAGVIQLLMQIYTLKHNHIQLYPAWRVDSPYFKKIMVMMGPMIIGLTATQINTLADDVIAWVFSASQEKGDSFTIFAKTIYYPMSRGSVSHLNYAQRLYQFPLGVIGISLATAIFPVLSKSAAKKDFATLSAAVAKGIRTVVALALPAGAGLILISHLLFGVLFQRGHFTAEDSRITAVVLCCYSVGLVGFFAQQILTRAFYSMQNTRAPLKTALIAIAVNLPLNLILIWFIGEAGLALSTALCSYIQVIILVRLLKGFAGKEIMDNVAVTIVKAVIAAAVMFICGAAVLWLMAGLEDTMLFNVIRLTAVIAVSAAVFALSAVVLKIDEIKSLFQLRK